MKNLLLLFSLVLILGLSNCSKSNELSVLPNDVELLRIYIDEANALIDVTSEVDGNVSAIFITSAITDKSCEGDISNIQGGMDAEVALMMNDLIDKMGFESALDIHIWMVEAGKILNGINEANRKNFDSERLMMTTLACLIVPEIMTRNSSSACLKDNLVTLLSKTLAAGSRYGSLKTSMSETACYSQGSSFNKIWLFMKNSYECES